MPADPQQQIVSPILLVYRPSSQSTVLVGPSFRANSDNELREQMYQPFLGSVRENLGLTYIRSFGWAGGTVCALTRLSAVEDPISGRQGLDIAIGAWLHPDALLTVASPFQLVASWLRIAADRSRRYGGDIDELDAIVLASVDEDEDALESIRESLWSNCAGVRYARGRSRMSQRHRLHWLTRRNSSSIPFPYLVAGHPEPLRYSDLMLVACAAVDIYLEGMIRRRGVSIVALDSIASINKHPSRLPPVGQYRRLSGGGIVLY